MFANEKKSSKPTIMERNIIAKNTTFIGELTSDGDFRIDGVLEGTLKTKGRVIIGLEGNIKGTVDCENADIEGKFSGDLKVNSTLTIKATASIVGEVVIGKLSVEPGASVNATCSMKGALKDINQKDAKSATEKTA
jgi:cytoskeletal protein CcmA (bactofilin family)